MMTKRGLLCFELIFPTLIVLALLTWAVFYFLDNIHIHFEFPRPLHLAHIHMRFRHKYRKLYTFTFHLLCLFIPLCSIHFSSLEPRTEYEWTVCYVKGGIFIFLVFFFIWLWERPWIWYYNGCRQDGLKIKEWNHTLEKTSYVYIIILISIYMILVFPIIAYEHTIDTKNLRIVQMNDWLISYRLILQLLVHYIFWSELDKLYYEFAKRSFQYVYYTVWFMKFSAPRVRLNSYYVVLLIFTLSWYLQLYNFFAVNQCIHMGEKSLVILAVLIFIFNKYWKFLFDFIERYRPMCPEYSYIVINFCVVFLHVILWLIILYSGEELLEILEIIRAPIKN
jgi:hypothetical protein